MPSRESNCGSRSADMTTLDRGSFFNKLQASLSRGGGNNVGTLEEARVRCCDPDERQVSCSEPHVAGAGLMVLAVVAE